MEERGELFDRIARVAAGSLPRRQALRAIAGLLAGAAVDSFWPGRAAAAVGVLCGAIRCQVGQICCDEARSRCCSPPGEICCGPGENFAADCCAARSLTSLGSHCCGAKAAQACCEIGTVCCPALVEVIDDIVAPPATPCCPDERPVCCPKGTGPCCPATLPVCCPDHFPVPCCEAGTFCCPEFMDINTGEAVPPAALCCPPFIRRSTGEVVPPVCCPKGSAQDCCPAPFPVCCPRDFPSPCCPANWFCDLQRGCVELV